MDHKAFVSVNKSMLIAPAGYGKTHSIAESLLHTEGKHLILTHTHAGVASIKQKIKSANLSRHKFHIETITSFAQKYVNAYCNRNDMPGLDESNAYYTFIITTATEIIKWPIIKKSISSTYTGMFIDEYQDCTLAQHTLISVLSNILPTHILGDPLQGIFNFKNIPMVNLEDNNLMGEFNVNIHILEEPWRWKEKNEALGNSLKEIRSKIVAKEPIDLRNYPAIEVITVADGAELHNPKKEYYKTVSKLIAENNLLMLHPISSSINARLKIISAFKIPISLIESIDDKDFYKIAKLIDTITAENIERIVAEICFKLFNKRGVGRWFSDKGLISKRMAEEKIISIEIAKKLTDIKQQFTFTKLSFFLKYIASFKEVRCFRKELFFSLITAMHSADINKISVYDAMVEKRNHIRRAGRKIHGRCFGTTLLTKGLEFETVIILNAHDYSCPKNLYVALTRASKRLIVFTTNPILQPKY